MSGVFKLTIFYMHLYTVVYTITAKQLKVGIKASVNQFITPRKKVRNMSSSSTYYTRTCNMNEK